MPRITPKDPGGVLNNSRADQTIEPGSLLESCGVATAAIYYPGFHRSPDNDAFWGTGWTEWDHLRHLKADLVTGDAVRHPLRYYDIGADGGATLRQQAAQARAAGLKAFVFYHYWFEPYPASPHPQP